jgi:adenylate cyclase
MREIARKFLELGIDATTPLDVVIAVRSANLCAGCLVLVSMCSAGAYLFSAKVPLLAVLNLGLALSYLGCLLFSAAGLARPARWLFLATGAVQYVQFNLAFGHAGGGTFWLAGLLAYPVVAFTRVERRQVLVVYGGAAALCVATEVMLRSAPPLVRDPFAQEQAYYFTVIALAAVVGFGIHYYKNSSIAARADLSAANSRIAELLDNLLPSSIVKRIEHGERVIADSHGEASVLFADLTGFSVLTRRLSPTHLVEVLNHMFSRFDEAAARHGIEKIKTIGDCYMAATGVIDDPSRPAQIDSMAEFALEMLEVVAAVGRELGLPLGVRIGISTGAVVSGVIGTTRVNFDVWGDTVNLASQMESTGVVGRIQVSEATYWRLQRHYLLEPRGEIAVKSGQRVDTYFLVGPAGVEDEGDTTLSRVSR